MKKIGRQVEFLGTSEFNQRNGEGAFIKLKNGSILFGFTEFLGNDWDDDFCARISYILSDDDGETWKYSRLLDTRWTTYPDVDFYDGKIYLVLILKVLLIFHI